MFLLPRPFFVYVLGLTNINTFHLFHGNQGFLMVCRPKLSPTACFLWLIQLVLVLVFFNKEVSSLSWKIKIAGNAWSIFCMTIVSWTWLEPVACRHSPPPPPCRAPVPALPEFNPTHSTEPLGLPWVYGAIAPDFHQRALWSTFRSEGQGGSAGSWFYPAAKGSPPFLPGE